MDPNRSSNHPSSLPDRLQPGAGTNHSPPQVRTARGSIRNGRTERVRSQLRPLVAILTDTADPRFDAPSSGRTYLRRMGRPGPLGRPQIAYI
jgi:hypothetical protein